MPSAPAAETRRCNSRNNGFTWIPVMSNPAAGSCFAINPMENGARQSGPMNNANGRSRKIWIWSRRRRQRRYIEVLLKGETDCCGVHLRLFVGAILNKLRNTSSILCYTLIKKGMANDCALFVINFYIVCYALYLFLRNPSPASPEPKRNIDAGSGTDRSPGRTARAAKE